MPVPEQMADQLMAEHDIGGLKSLESSLVGRDTPLETQIAAKLAISKSALRHVAESHISVVFAMYKETRRMLPVGADPVAEDFVNAKVAQLRWLFDGDEGWDLIMVDDGCPDGSGHMARGVIADAGLGDVARVLFLEEAIRSGHPVAAELDSTDDSRKGGAIHLGMYEAVDERSPNQIVAYTDADMSTHLGQLGLLAAAIEEGATCAAGSRREPTSVVVKGGARNDRGKIFIYLWKQMLPALREIVDSQCGFKGFRADAVRGLVMNAIEKKFAFDIELLLRCEQVRAGSVAKIPVAWVDSEAASTTTDLEPYLPMLKAAAAMYRRYSDPDGRAESFVGLIDNMNEAGWKALVESAPAEIVDREPNEFMTWAGVEAQELAALIA